MNAAVRALIKFLLDIPFLGAVLLLALGSLLGYLTWFSLSREVSLSREGEQAIVTVETYHPGKRWGGTAGVTHEVDGEEVKARLHTWGRVEPGEQVRVLYPRDQPHLLSQDSWLRFLAPLLTGLGSALFLVGGLVIGRRDVSKLLSAPKGSPPEGT